MYRILVVIFSVLMISSCGVFKGSTDVDAVKAKTESIAKNNFKGDYTIDYNKNYEFGAVTKKLKIDNGKKSDYRLKTMIYDIKNNKIIWGNKSKNGKLKWISKYQVKIDYQTRDNTDASLIYDAKNKKVEHKQ